MATAAELALGLGLSYWTTLRRLRSGRIAGEKVRGRWQVHGAAVQEAYAERADGYFQARRAIPRDAHHPTPNLAWRYVYQFVYTALLTCEEGDSEEVTDFSFNHAHDAKPSSRELWRALREEVQERYLGTAEESEEERDEREKYVQPGGDCEVVSVRLLDAHLVRAQRRS